MKSSGLQWEPKLMTREIVQTTYMTSHILVRGAPQSLTSSLESLTGNKSPTAAKAVLWHHRDKTLLLQFQHFSDTGSYMHIFTIAGLKESHLLCLHVVFLQ
ncbi:hypothetical protein RJ640_021749 [Escallonia rubra]|uniref:Uncharacterized protein n=1 Tax=Escallonia rubra TaxID=112253 RepID=A0AA88UF81_9ASTE|nr:hypothetical protein RJ640_021749 [Escallonia rubra]